MLLSNLETNVYLYRFFSIFHRVDDDQCCAMEDACANDDSDPTSTTNNENEEIAGLMEGFLGNSDDDTDDKEDDMPKLSPHRASRRLQSETPKVSHDTSSNVNGQDASVDGSTASESSTSLRTTIRRIRGNDVGQPVLPSDERSSESSSTDDTSVTVNGNDASVDGSSASESSTTPLLTTIRRIRGNDVGQPVLPSDERSPRTTAEGTSPSTIGEVSLDTSSTINGHDASAPVSPSDERSPRTTGEGTSPSTIGEVSHDTASTINGHDASVNGSTASTSARRIRTNNKRLIVGTRVSGAHGELVPNPKGHGRRVRDRAIGSIVASCENNKYKVKFDNGKIKECSSSSLRIENIVVALPVNEITPQVRERIEEEGDEIIEHDGEDECDDSDGEEIVNVGDINASADIQDIVHQVPPGTPESYHEKLNTARSKVASLLGDSVDVGPANAKLTWTVVKEHVAPEENEILNRRKEMNRELGFKDINTLKEEDRFQDPSVASSDGTSSLVFPLKPPQHKKCTIFGKMFLKLMYMDWHEMLVKFNRAVDKGNTGGSGRDVRRFTGSEFIVGHAILIAATCYSVTGSKLWNNNVDDEDDDWETILECPGFEKFMKLYRFKQFRKYLPLIFENDSLKEVDPWWKFTTAVDSFNAIRKERCISSYLKVFDESMSAWRPRISKLGGLPNISFILRKPEPLGTEFKNICCGETGIMQCLEICRGKEGMKEKRLQRELGATAACTVRVTELCHQEQYSPKDLVMGDAWFGSVKAATELAKRNSAAFLQVKTNHKLYPKDYINEALEDAPGGTHIVLKGMFIVFVFSIIIRSILTYFCLFT